jgi:dipeptidyl aminopeptidase/acylaminoacyl peptidase
MRRTVSSSQKAALVITSVAVTLLSAHAQTPTPTATPPASDIFVLEVGSKRNKDTKQLEPNFTEAKKITDYAGYNNQPFFLPDGHRILYTSIRNGQADIYSYDLKSGQTTQVTNTPESEYSPTLMPDGKNISVVRVEKDGTQRLWKFPLAGGSPSLILENVKPVGYHHWIDDHTLALFVLGSTGKPNTLQIADTRTGKSEIVAENPGRVLRKVPARNQFSFVHKISDQHWEIKYFDMRSHTIASFVETLPGAEDYAWLNGALLMGKDSKLYAVRPFAGQKWTEVGDLSKAGIKRITRIAVSGNRIAIVAVSEARP